MKTFISLLLIFQLVGINVIKVQVAIQGDTLYQNLQVWKSKLDAITSAFGEPNSKEELTIESVGHLRDGGDIHKSFLYGYALKYKRQGLTFHIDNDTYLLSSIRFGAKSRIITVKGIQPGVSTFADVTSMYGAPDPHKSNITDPHFHQWIDNRWKKNEKKYTIITYGKITFASYGKFLKSEDVSKRRIDEIWLD